MSVANVPVNDSGGPARASGYLYRRADGTDEGGETTKILMAREKRSF